MLWFQLNAFVFICICLTALANDSSQANDEIRSVKKDLKIGATAEATPQLVPQHKSQPKNLTNNEDPREENSLNEIKARFFQKNHDIEMPESFKIFYIFMGLSITAIFCILLKIYRMRLSRAERKYGVHGDRTTQELTPLPIAIEDDSDNEDHTLFDINRQIRVS